jgi:hypothetical protein
MSLWGLVLSRGWMILLGLKEIVLRVVEPDRSCFVLSSHRRQSVLFVGH